MARPVSTGLRTSRPAPRPLAGGRTGATTPPVPRQPRYWKSAATGALAIFGLIVVRFPEMLLFLRPLRPVLLASVVLVAMFVSRSSVQAKRLAMRDPVAQLLLGLVGWAVLTLPFALYMGSAIQELMVFPWAFVVVGSFLLIEPRLENLDRVHVGIVIQAAMLAAYLTVFGRDLTGSGRLTGTGTYDPNDLAALLCFLWPFCLALLRRRDVRLVALGWIAMALIALTISRTGSRGGLLGWIAGTVLFYIGSHPARLAKILIVCVLCGVLLWGYAPPVFRERAASLLEPENDYNAQDEAGRIKIWTRGLGYLAARPINGVGLKNFAVAEGNHFMKQGKAAPWFSAHNMFIQVAVELGLVGFGIFMGVLWSCGKRTFPLWQPSVQSTRGPRWYRPELLSALVAYMTAAFFLSLAYSFLTFGVISVLAFASRVQQASRPMVTRHNVGPG